MLLWWTRIVASGNRPADAYSRCRAPPQRLGASPDAGPRSHCYLSSLYVLRLPALRPFSDVELDALALLQTAKPAGLDRREVDEDVFAFVSSDESKALSIVKPLNCSLFHCADTCFSEDFSG
jgi:hypothetical protein